MEWMNKEEWEEYLEEYRAECSEKARAEHKVYLRSPEWAELKEKIMGRDSCVCQDCIKILPSILKLFNKIPHNQSDYKPFAGEVHHLDYSFLHTPEEADYCISLCSTCHQLRHISMQYDLQRLTKKREEILILRIHNRILKEPWARIEAKKQHDSYIQSLTMKPTNWLKQEVLKIGEGKRIE